VPAFKFSLEMFVDCVATGDNLKILIMAGEGVVFRSLNPVLFMPPSH
jgi:hypothetical protein